MNAMKAIIVENKSRWKVPAFSDLTALMDAITFLLQIPIENCLWLVFYSLRTSPLRFITL
ncbi:hypothetical protein K1T71_000578 [Dendrolimus kikuchii]|uniref:Uncharacterized protein n=1 Tax=Dendrolimus kikuchii TaxID=765133 RepID=A0ACC1DJS4_9NEOP|nr:hypothetical protein K1T71_000578 [Dendrolimus kikuchii]